MLGSALAVVLLVTFVHAQEGEIAIPDNKTQCLNDMIQWCNNMQYPEQGAGMTILSVSYRDSTGHHRVFCYSDFDGTNCTRNGKSWFTCSSDHTFTYKGNVVTSNSTDVDDEICNTADQAFNRLFVQNLSYNSTIAKDFMVKEMESFFKEMSAMKAQLDELQKQLQGTFGQDYWGGMDDDFPFNRPSLTTMVSSDGEQSGTDQTNEIEKE